MAIKQLVAPAILPVTISEAKIHERIDVEDAANDASILALLSSATQLAENYTRRAFIKQRWIMSTPIAGPIISIPRPPLIEVIDNTVEFIDTYNVATPVDPTLYFTNNIYTPARLIWKGMEVPAAAGGFSWWWPQDWWNDLDAYYGSVLQFEYWAGYGDTADTVPWEIKEGILQIFGSLYENRESQEIPGGAKQLLQPFRVEYL